MSWFEAKVIQRVPMRYPGFMRRVYPGFLQFAGFVAMNPTGTWNRTCSTTTPGRGRRRQRGRASPLLRRVQRVMDLPAEYYLETVERVFHKHAAAAGQARRAGERVRPEAITDTALFTIEGELDDISGNGQTEAAQALARAFPRSDKQHFSQGRRPLRHLQRPQVPRDDLSEDSRVHRAASINLRPTCLPKPSRTSQPPSSIRPSSARHSAIPSGSCGSTATRGESRST
jgi:hypothetical protein